MATNDCLHWMTKHRALILVISGLAAFAIILLTKEYPLLVRAANVYTAEGPSGVVDRVTSYGRLLIGSPVQWPSATPAAYGLDDAEVRKLVEQLAERHTKAFLLAKDGHLIYEWYADDHSADKKLATAAMAKPVIGSVVLMAAIDDGRISLDDPAWKYIPQWKDDPQKSKITICHLGSHQSGLDDVEFRDDVSPDWKLTYYKNPDLRFSMALSETPLIFEPGTRTVYSGVGYYVLAYALAKSLQDTPEPDVREFLATRIMEPLQIPPEAWDISYGTYYQQDGMKLYAIGSGGGYTPRAVARIGQFMLNEGEWDGQQLLDPRTVHEVLGKVDSGESLTSEAAPIGWLTNSDGRLSSLPSDAYWGLGQDDQVLLVIPSLDVVMVRMGESLSPESPADADPYEALEEYLFKPLMEAIN